MTHTGLTANKRVIAILLAVLFACAVAFSLAFVLHVAGHDCSGEDCPVCARIAACLNVLRTLLTAVFIAAAAVFAARFAVCAMRRFAAPAQTPTVLKVRLLN